MINEKFKAFLEAVLHNSDMPDLRLDRWQTDYLSKLWEQRYNQAVKNDQMDAWSYAYLGRGNNKKTLEAQKMLTKSKVNDLYQKIITSTGENESIIVFSKEELAILSEIVHRVEIRLSGCDGCFHRKQGAGDDPCVLCLRNPIQRDYYNKTWEAL